MTTDPQAARDNLIGYCLAATPNEATFERAEQLADAYRDALTPAVPGRADDALRDRIAETMARADGWEWAAANFSALSTPAADRYRRCAEAVLAVLPPAADRAAASAALWAAAEHHTVAEWICCDPIDPAHALCVQGGAALRMLKALLVDDPEAWKPAPLLDEVMQFVAPAGSTAEAHRLALSFALGLGTGAPWDAIHDRATELGLPPLAEDPVAQRRGLVPAPAGRAAVLREEAALIRAHCPDHLDSNSAEGSWINCHCDVADDMERRADETQQLEPTTAAASEPRANETGGTVAEAQQQPDTETDEVALLRLTLDAVEEGRRELRSDIARLRSQLWTLAAIFEGFGRLLATSSRDWGQYAPDAWLYAVICGWDCEEAVHDETCTHGAMEEMQQRHGWDDKTVAKARRYRAVVHTLTAPAAPGRSAAGDTSEEA